MSDEQSLNAFLGKGSNFEGKLTFEGKVQIDGNFVGEIFSTDTLVIGEGADVRAEIEVGTAVVHGKMDGNIRATECIELRAPGEMHGNIEAPQLEVERGVLFEGNCKMTGGSPASRSSAAPAYKAPPSVDNTEDLGI
jgi:cytoskeletal protein CcmA (bactofilin family)